jgi:hypothetical protein
LVPNLAVRLNGGRVVQNTEDSIIRIVGLEPYTDYLLTLDDKSLEQISYRIPNKNLRVFASPNGFRRIDVPILPMGEVNGWVFLKEKNGRRGQERMLVNFYAENGEKVASTQTETDGGFTYLGLAPGHYLARVDSLQLTRLGMTASVVDVPFEIKPDVLGDIVYDLQLFVEKPAKETEIENDRQGGEKVAETQQLQVSTITDIAETVAEEFYSLQMGSFRNQTYAEQFADMLKYRFDLPVWVDHENRLYKVRMGKFTDREAVDEFRKSIWEKGFDSFPVLKKK